MDYKDNTNQNNNKPFAVPDRHVSVNQIDTTGQLLAEIYKIVQRMDKREDAFFKKLSGMKNDH